MLLALILSMASVSHGFQTIVVLVVLSSIQPGLSCFQQVTSLSSSPVWIQATDTFSHIRYEILKTKDKEDSGSIRLLQFYSPHERKIRYTKLISTFKCHTPVSPTTLVVVSQQEGSKDVEFQCMRFEPLSKHVVRLSRTPAKSSHSEVNCETDHYSADPAVLIASEKHVFDSPCPLQGSYQAKLSTSPCMATLRFHCTSQSRGVMVTFSSVCKLPLFKYNSNRIRHYSSFYLSCVGGWTEHDGSNTLVLRNDDRTNIWCLHYKTLYNSDEVVDLYINFDGQCASNAFNTETAIPKNTMHGHMAKYIHFRDRRCSDKQCKGMNIDCSKTNMCPGECGRCYKTPKTKSCEFPVDTIGRWEMMTSKQLKVDVDSYGIRTSKNGKFSCAYEKGTRGFAFPVVQYDKSAGCLPLHACAQAFGVTSGVMNFYLRLSHVDSIAKPMTCQETNALFKENNAQEGKMITLLNEDKLGESPCNFGEENLFPTDRGNCLLNVSTCAGSCQTMQLDYDNETCHHMSSVLPKLVKRHQCYASLKFKDGIRGLITYSEELDKLSCWVYTSTRVFVADSHLCNYEAVQEIFMDKYALDKYDPLNAFTALPSLEATSLGNTPVLGLISILFLFCNSLYMMVYNT